MRSPAVADTGGVAPRARRIVTPPTREAGLVHDKAIELLAGVATTLVTGSVGVVTGTGHVVNDSTPAPRASVPPSRVTVAGVSAATTAAVAAGRQGGVGQRRRCRGGPG